MQYLNRSEILGHLGRDPVQRFTNGGKKIVSFSVATSEGYTDKDTGELKTFVEWHKVNVFNQGMCDLIMSRLKAGSLVYVEGQKRTREYVTNAGKHCRDAEVVVQPFSGRVIFLDSKADEELAELARKGFIIDPPSDDEMEDIAGGQQA